ncbi:MAG: asparagine synthase (glutamine-hydrolyzing) [Bacteroidales bacterium]|jgi:asparagine synthase (glutamine-hydrolysing)|nr:asparagine synthase (glutamine-hydrolyzing) [Bacteroidales bacterium]
MCAILGVFAKSSLNLDVQSRFKKALSLTTHRGPDSSNEIFLQNAFLGFNRLSIVGEKNGSQPFSNEDSTVFLLCNGEIYNYKNLRQELKCVHNFSTDSDCEIILHLYEEDSKNFSSKLRGQFSFVIFDRNKNKLVFGRDRFGINPLYYSSWKSGILVSSEIKSLLALDKSISKSLDPIGLKETFYLYGPTPPRTCFNNVFQVEPGHVITIDLVTNAIVKNKCYWSFPKEDDLKLDGVKKKFSKLLKRAVELRLQSDKSNFGVYLSGGLDSSSIVTLLVKVGELPQCFSIKFLNEELDESKHQETVTRLFELPLFSVIGENVFDSFVTQSIWHIEHPLIRTAPVPMYGLSQLVRNHDCKYVYCGEGADEILLGYPVFIYNLCSIEDKISEYSKLENLFKYKRITGKKLVRDQIVNTAKKFNIPSDSTRNKQLVEIQTKLSRYLLVQQGDRLSMSHGVEQRFPFLDEDFVDFLFSIPLDWFKNNCMNKQLLRKYIRNLVPENISSRKKQGYLAPMDQQLYSSPFFSELIEQTGNNEFIRIVNKYFDVREFMKLVEGFKARTLSDIETIGILLVLSTYILHIQFFESSQL